MHKFKYINSRRNSESSLDSDAEDYFGFPKKNNNYSIETSKSMSIEGQVLSYLNNKSYSLQSLEECRPIIKTLFIDGTIPPFPLLPLWKGCKFFGRHHSDSQEIQALG